MLQDETVVAALDLGSNSFHLVVARVIESRVHVVDKLKERVQLAAGLDEDNVLDEGAQQRALECLARFGHRLASLEPAQVRAVGTNTLRKAVNGDVFVEAAEAALGHPIEVVSGQEEARLVYVGVAGSIHEGGGGRRLVVDIGGGSTECIIGVGPSLVRADSLYMGCVGYTRRFFDDGRITPKRMQRAITAARLEFGSIHRMYKGLGWAQCYGSSGTVAAIERVLTENHWSDHCITQEGLDALEAALFEAGHARDLALPGLKADRAPVLAGGYAILAAVFRSLEVERMVASTGALREGVLQDLLGRVHGGDVREETVSHMRQRYAADVAQAQRVERTALALLAQAAVAWALDVDEATRMLRWAAQLHEIGKAISYAGYHRHGAYLVQHSDMPGFSKGEKSLLAALVLAQRRKLVDARLGALVTSRQKVVRRLGTLLRIAVQLNRTRSQNPPPTVDLAVKGDTLHLIFPEVWLDERPLTRADLEEETARLAAAKMKLTWG